MLIIGPYITRTVYEVWTTINEFGQSGELIGYFTDEKVAREEAQGKGWYGGEGLVIKIIALNIINTSFWFALKNDEPIKLDEKLEPSHVIREKALAKLSTKEKIALGLQSK
jgi:hypothetical protein